MVTDMADTVHIGTDSMMVTGPELTTDYTTIACIMKTGTPATIHTVEVQTAMAQKEHEEQVRLAIPTCIESAE
jgi:hypothetical protein